jgi:hypothetical protein
MKLKVPESVELPETGCSSLQSKVGWALLLLTMGAADGLLILGQSILLNMSVAVLYRIPWSRISLCREHILTSGLIALIGMGTPLLIFHQSLSPISLLIIAWLLWTFSMLCIFSRIEILWQAERKIRAMTAALATAAS